MTGFYFDLDRRVQLQLLALIQTCLVVLVCNAPAASMAEERGALLPHVKDCDTCSEMIAVPAGKYMMGATEEEFKGVMNKYKDTYQYETPRHLASVNAFLLAKYDVTRKEFSVFAKETGFQGKGCRVVKGHDFTDDPSADWGNPGFKQTDQDPVVCVSWNDAHKFIDWLNSKSRGSSRLKYRLPTETEWEYAARAGTTTAAYWGSDRQNQCKYENAYDRSASVLGLDVIDHEHPFADCADGFVETSPVGSFQSNPWGFADILGDVSQWMEDCPEPGYSTLPSVPPRSNSVFCRDTAALRGASWASVPMMVRAAFRGGGDVKFRESATGFRLAADRTN